MKETLLQLQTIYCRALALVCGRADPGFYHVHPSLSATNLALATTSH